MCISVFCVLLGACNEPSKLKPKEDALLQNLERTAELASNYNQQAENFSRFRTSFAEQNDALRQKLEASEKIAKEQTQRLDDLLKAHDKVVEYLNGLNSFVQEVTNQQGTIEQIKRSLDAVILSSAPAPKTPQSAPTHTSPNGLRSEPEKINKLEFDLIEAKFCGRNLFDLSLDQITDVLGRPTLISDPGARKVKLAGAIDDWVPYGATADFDQAGLHFEFAHSDNDKNQRCISATIYLAKTWRSNHQAFFTPFPGKLSPKQVDGGWKSKRVLEEFAEFKPQDGWDNKSMVEQYKNRVSKDDWDSIMRLQEEITVTPAQRTAARNATAALESLEQTEKKYLNRISITHKGNELIFQYEENTKFIERVILNK